MTTYQTPELSLEPTRIPEEDLEHFRRTLQLELYSVVSKEFYRLVDAGKLSPSILAERLGRNPSQVTRWITGPGNWTLSSLSDLLVGMGLDPRRIVGRLRPRPNELVSESLPTVEQPAPNDPPHPRSIVSIRTTLRELAANAGREADAALSDLSRSMAPAQDQAKITQEMLMAKIDELVALVPVRPMENQDDTTRRRANVIPIADWVQKRQPQSEKPNVYDLERVRIGA